MLVHSLQMRKRLTRHVFHMFVTHANFVYDVTDTDCSIQNDHTHCRVLATLSCCDFVPGTINETLK